MLISREVVKEQLEKYDITQQVNGIYSSELEAINHTKSLFKKEVKRKFFNKKG